MDAQSLLWDPGSAGQIAVFFLDHFAKMDADAEFDTSVVWRTSVALDHRPLDFNGEVHCVDDAAKLDDTAVAGAFDDPVVAGGEGRVDRVASERPQPRQNPVLVGSSKPRIADDVGHQDRRKLSSSLTALVPKPDHRSQLAWAWLHFHAALMIRGGRECRPGVQPVGLAR